MNRFSTSRQKATQAADPLVRQENRFRQDTVNALRDIAFVLKITERVKAAILEQPELAASVMA